MSVLSSGFAGSWQPDIVRAVTVCVCTAVVAASCGSREPPALALEGALPVVLEEAGLVGSVADLAVNDDGDLLIADQLNGHLVVVSPSGEQRVVGGRGKGPGEFETPAALATSGDTIWVVDSGLGRVQRLTSDGRYVGGYPLPMSSVGTPAISPSYALLPTMGLLMGGLAAVVDANGGEVGMVGELVTAARPSWDFTAMKEEVTRGRIPAALRNTVLPVIGPRGEAWLILLSDGVIQKYSESLELEWTKKIKGAVFDRIRSEFFRKNMAEKRPFVFSTLSYADDAVADKNNRLWVLVNIPKGEEPVIYLYEPDGRPAARLSLSGVPDASQIAVDSSGEALYVSIPSRAEVVRFPIRRTMASLN